MIERSENYHIFQIGSIAKIPNRFAKCCLLYNYTAGVVSRSDSTIKNIYLNCFSSRNMLYFSMDISNNSHHLNVQRVSKFGAQRMAAFGGPPHPQILVVGSVTSPYPVRDIPG